VEWPCPWTLRSLPVVLRVSCTAVWSMSTDVAMRRPRVRVLSESLPLCWHSFWLPARPSGRCTSASRDWSETGSMTPTCRHPSTSSISSTTRTDLHRRPLHTGQHRFTPDCSLFCNKKPSFLCGHFLVVEASGPDVDRATGDPWQQSPAACPRLHQPSKARHPPGIRFLGVHHRRLFVTDLRRLWDFLERIGAVTRPLDWE